jgi:hypothetical protein
LPSWRPPGHLHPVCYCLLRCPKGFRPEGSILNCFPIF